MKTSLHILNLEDSATDAELNVAVLSARWPRCEYRHVDTRADFIAALEQERFDLILSDYTLPGFNGMEALALAREKQPETPFLFVSGTIGEDAAIEALKMGATDYVLKHRLMRLIPAADRALRETAERVEREHAEEAMRQSEHKYRILFESLSDAAFLVDVQTGKIIDVNRRTCELLGLERGGILGRRQSDFLALAGAGSEPAPAARATMTCANGAPTLTTVRSTWLTLHGRKLVLRLCQAPNDQPGSPPSNQEKQ